MKIKKQLKNLIIKLDRFFFFEKMELTDFEKRILITIGYAILKNFSEDYDKAYTLLHQINISHVKYRNNKIHLYLARPGLIIGREGLLLRSITNELKFHLKNDKLEIIIHERDLWLYYPIDYRDY